MVARVKRPTHTTIVAYLALFVAIATGGAWAATQIKSSKQIKKGAVQGSDVKDENLTGKDIGPKAIGRGELADGAVGTGSVEDRSLLGADLGLDALGSAEIDQDSLGLADGVSQTIQSSQGIDNGGGFSAPRSPEGDLLGIVLPAGRHFVTAHVNVGADDGGAGIVCSLDAGTGNPIDTGTSVSANSYGASLNHVPDSVSASVVTDLSSPFTATFSCADAGSGATAFDRTMSAISLTG